MAESITLQGALIGLNNLSLNDYVTKKPVANFELIGSVGVDVSTDKVDLVPAGFKVKIDSFVTGIEYTLSTTLEQVNAPLLQYVNGNTVTEFVPSITGELYEVSDIDGNFIEATTGVATVQLTPSEEANVRISGWYAVAVSPTTVDVYSDTRLSGIEYVPGTLKVNATPITILDAGGTSKITDVNNNAVFGVEFEGGSGTVALVVGSAITFQTTPPHSGRVEAVIGADDSAPNVEAVFYSDKDNEGGFTRVKLFKVKFTTPVPMSLTAKELFTGDAEADVQVDGCTKKVGIVELVNGAGQITACPVQIIL